MYRSTAQCQVHTRKGFPVSSPEPDHELFVRYQTRHQRRVFSYIMTLLPNWNDAEEVLQETSLVLWRKFSDFQPGTSFVSWANRVAYFEVQKFRQRQKRADRVFGDELIDVLAAQSEGMRDLLADQQEALQYCLEKLPDVDRRLITSRYISGASSRSLAQELSRSLESVCNSLKRIRHVLLRCVQRQEMETVS